MLSEDLLCQDQRWEWDGSEDFFFFVSLSTKKLPGLGDGMISNLRQAHHSGGCWVHRGENVVLGTKSSVNPSCSYLVWPCLPSLSTIKDGMVSVNRLLSGEDNEFRFCLWISFLPQGKVGWLKAILPTLWSQHKPQDWHSLSLFLFAFWAKALGDFLQSLLCDYILVIRDDQSMKWAEHETDTLYTLVHYSCV